MGQGQPGSAGQYQNDDAAQRRDPSGDPTYHRQRRAPSSTRPVRPKDGRSLRCL